MTFKPSEWKCVTVSLASAKAIANLDEHVEKQLMRVNARLDDHETRLTTLEQAA
jgi:hypothetical protein